MEVDSPDDDENHSPCYQRLKLKGKIATVQMRLKTFHDLQATFNTSNPSLMETTSAAAAEQQVKLDALVSERDSLPECLTFNCQFCNNSNPLLQWNQDVLNAERNIQPSSAQWERQENPFCINCKEHGHSACYTKCPLFPKPKKGATLPMISKSKVNNCKDGITYANVVSGRDSAPIPTPSASETIQQCECKNTSKGIHGINQDNNSELAQFYLNPCSLPTSISLVDPVLLASHLPPHWTPSETPPTINYQVATPSQLHYKIEDGGIIRFQFLVQYSSWGPRGRYKLDLTRFSGYKFRFTSAGGGAVDLLRPGPEISLNRLYV
ncbi:hypothetical protein TNCV_574531 [Trichonephila clavipes]|nr:hypothetical protein TNCV_574531 [Trichonephila clavipes]